MCKGLEMKAPLKGRLRSNKKAECTWGKWWETKLARKAAQERQGALHILLWKLHMLLEVSGDDRKQ